MKNDVHLPLATCDTCDRFHNPSKRQSATLNPIPPNDGRDILAIDVFDGKASLPETPLANRYILPMADLFTKLGVAAHMPEKSAQTVADAIVSRGVLFFGAPAACSRIKEQSSSRQHCKVYTLFGAYLRCVPRRSTQQANVHAND